MAEEPVAVEAAALEETVEEGTESEEDAVADSTAAEEVDSCLFTTGEAETERARRTEERKVEVFMMIRDVV